MANIAGLDIYQSAKTEGTLVSANQLHPFGKLGWSWSTVNRPAATFTHT